MTLTPEQATALVDQHRELTATVRQLLSGAATDLMRGLGSWSDAALAEFLAEFEPLLIAAERQVAAQTAAYIGAATPDAGRVEPGPLDRFTGEALRNGVPVSEVYARPFVAARTAYSRGADVADAVTLGDTALRAEIATDLQTAELQSATYQMGVRGVKQYRRVASANACIRCRLAADRAYYSDDLMPRHPGCSCTILPATRLPRTLELRMPQDGRDVTVEISDELGPMLVDAPARPRLTSDVSRPGRRRRPEFVTTPEQRIEMKRAQLASYEAQIAKTGGTEFAREKAAELRAELAAL